MSGHRFSEQWKRLAILVGAVGVVAFYASGCGGSEVYSASGSGGGATPSGELSGSITVPGADTLKLTVTSALGTTEATAGAFTVKAVASNLGLLTAYDKATGQVVAVGMTDPTGAKTVLDAKNCAATLIYLGLGGSQLAPADRMALWKSVAASSQVTTLAAVITSEAKANPHALDTGSTKITVALASAVNALGSLVSGFKAQNGPSAKLVSGAPSTRASDPPAELFLSTTPEINHYGEVSSNGTSVFANNLSSRLEGSLLAYYRGYTDFNLAFHPVPLAQVGTTAFDPHTKSPEIALKKDPTTRADQFVFVVLQPVFDAADPDFYSEPDYAPYVAKYKAALGPMYQRGLASIAGYALLDAYGVPPVDIDLKSLDASVAGFKGVSAASASIWGDAANGKGLSSLVGRVAGVAAGGDADAYSTLVALAPLIKAQMPDLAQTFETKSLTSEQLKGFRGAARVLSALGVWDLSSKLGARAEAFVTGSAAKRVTGHVSSNGVALAPASGQYDFSVKGLLMTATSDPKYVAQPVKYTWTLSGTATHAALNDGKGHFSEHQIVTDSATCYLVGDSTTVGNAIVSVSVPLVYSNGQTHPVSDERNYSPPGTEYFDRIRFQSSSGPKFADFVSAITIKKPNPVGGVYKGGKVRLWWNRSGLPTTLTGGPDYNGDMYCEYTVADWSKPTIPSTTSIYTAVPVRVPQSGFTYTSPAASGIDMYDYGDFLLGVQFGGQGFAVDDTTTIDRINQNMLIWSSKAIAKYIYTPN